MIAVDSGHEKTYEFQRPFTRVDVEEGSSFHILQITIYESEFSKRHSVKSRNIHPMQSRSTLKPSDAQPIYILPYPSSCQQHRAGPYSTIASALFHA